MPVNDHQPNDQQPPQTPPAVRVPLRGNYLIEASAGTGKTWTLTGIVLRLLIEAKRAPEHIIATTFTRAAAAEMRERIHARLVDFHQLLQWLIKLQANRDTHALLYPLQTQQQSANSADDEQTARRKVSPEQQQARQAWLIEQATFAGNIDLISDPINYHLLTYLLDHTETYALSEANRRCALVLTTLDKLFVGTLDSLSQKWLSEYSAETGHQQGMKISDHEQVVTESIIHDMVRAFASDMYYRQPELYHLLQHTKRLTTPADHVAVAQKAMQFISTPIELVEIGEQIDLDGYRQTLAAFKDCDLTAVEPYFDKDYRKSQGFHATAGLGAKMDRIFDIQSAIEKNNTLFFAHLHDDAQKWYDAIPLAFLSKEEGGKGFNKNKEAERLTFINIEAITLLKKLHDYTTAIEQYLDTLIEILNRNIALKVRQQLPAILETRGETTFALQMVRLNQALSGAQGARLARYIRHHYPVALIDESQDINGEQARMIERIYLHQESTQDVEEVRRSRQFLLLVGDPKQAIYGFRGGDVANYNAMKARFEPRQRMSLDINRRSNARLIDALNHWFGRVHAPKNSAYDDSHDEQAVIDNSGCDTRADQLARLGKNIYYQHITAENGDSRVSWQQLNEHSDRPSVEAATVLPNSPVSILHLPYDKEAKYDAFELTALHIAALLASGQCIDGRPIQPSDIGVLGRAKRELKSVEDMLAKLGVPTLETAETNVFDTVIAADLVALLEAMLRPHRRDIINRVLTSHLYQLSLDEVQALMNSVDEHADTATNNADDEPVETQQRRKQRYQDFQTYLKTAASYWQQGSILSAMHYLLRRNPMATQPNGKDTDNKDPSVWVGLADLEDGARHLMDLRHLLDILAQHGMHIGEYELLAWYKKNMNSRQIPDWAQQQPLPTESGVQLMTIHKSKGLEFPVVYVVGMDKASNDASRSKGHGSKHKLYLYDHSVDAEHTERRLSASKGKAYSQSVKGDTEASYYADFETAESYEEMRRLAYVAFTRASEQLYIVVTDASTKTDAGRKPILQWLDGDDKIFTLPERLQGHIGWLHYASIVPAAETVIAAHKDQKKTASTKATAQAADENAASRPNDETSSRIDYRAAYAQLKTSRFKGWAKTSFTALARQLGEQSHALAVFDDSIEDEFEITGLTPIPADYTQDAAAYSSITADDIRFRFVKGANAGTFLHQVFEKIDFINTSKWSNVIDQGIRQYQLPSSYTSAENQQRLLQSSRFPASTDQANDQDDMVSIAAESLQAADHDALLAWVADVLAAPLLASGQPLRAIPKKQRIAELSFNMGLSTAFTPEHLNEAFRDCLPDDPDKHIELTAQYTEHLYRYLRGEIDLVYEYAGKFYVVDYKSNYLGDDISHYNDTNLSAAMNKAGYWLQAAIYQVALHRFLRLRLPNYVGHEVQYLGAVEYVFLRGIDKAGQGSYGRIQWQIPFSLVSRLDAILGTPVDGSDQ